MLWRFLASLAAHFGVFMPCVEGATISLAHQTERTGFPASLELFSGTGAGVALGEINANPSVLPGHILTIGTTVDGGCTKRQGVGGALDMVINQTWAPIAMGPLCSASVEGSNHVFSGSESSNILPVTNVQDSVVNAQDSVVDTLPSTFKQMTGSDLRVVSHYKMQPDAILYYCAAYRLGYFGDHLLYLTPMWNSRSWATLYPTEGCTPEIVGKGVGNSLSVISPFLRETDDAGTVLEGQRTPSAIWNEIWGPLQAGCAPLGLCDLIDPRDAWSIAGTFYDAVWLSALGLHSYLNDGQAALDGITADDLNTANVTKQSQIYSGLYRALINQDFKGVSGRVRFDSSANRVADMTVGYFDTELAVVDVGRIFIETGEIEWATPLSWTDGSTWHPPSGQFAKVAQALAICPAGYQRNEQDGCVPCEAGYFSPEEGSSCMWCPVGAISEGPASAVCKNCSEGWYAPSTGMSACRACPVGYFRNSSQSAGQCERCPLGTFNSATGSVQCSVCKDTKTTAGYASIVETDCTCKEGSFLNKVTDTCESCLEAMRCEGGDGIPDVKPGYWATAESTENFTGPSVVLHCYRNEEVCKGGPMARETKEDTTTPSRRLFSVRL
uniref:Uncharacterized protein n=1 Tax=Chromera velia CCMP2878 TaxID=1169474 RepID=A0A0G4I666_9ALVE|eukprot:Cvel_11332.t1-p1 / transcript=Cvel_11332.t1 / gene=Cvel_11332 / organism=Chromera_velia_CCMP2878 / gene_product=Signal peptide, CUB and EGF-like domain-containing, putative / transcript_product=Signal peptide, CUB and EGF-like domain-containing, putative / location=Cvel_scaffold709:42682-48863(+) / protein_length=611 / sequence_SO=supercontig / SO=protein_coding / is_pseudo=false